jgi:hypothetical protein
MKKFFGGTAYLIAIIVLSFLVEENLRDILGINLWDCDGGGMMCVPLPTWAFLFFWGSIAVLGWYLFKIAFIKKDTELITGVVTKTTPFKKILFFTYIILLISYYVFALHGPDIYRCNLTFNGLDNRSKDFCITDGIGKSKIDFQKKESICQGITDELNHRDMCLLNLSYTDAVKGLEICPDIKDISIQGYCYTRNPIVQSDVSDTAGMFCKDKECMENFASKNINPIDFCAKQPTIEDRDDCYKAAGMKNGVAKANNEKYCLLIEDFRKRDACLGHKKYIDEYMNVTLPDGLKKGGVLPVLIKTDDRNYSTAAVLSADRIDLKQYDESLYFKNGYQDYRYVSDEVYGGRTYKVYVSDSSYGILQKYKYELIQNNVVYRLVTEFRNGAPSYPEVLKIMEMIEIL